MLFRSVDKFLDSGYPSGTAARKARFVNALLRFIADDYPEDRFTNQLYEGLYNSGYFGFIAHYDLEGFKAYYSEHSLQDDIERNARANQWNNFRAGERDAEYYHSKRDCYNMILGALAAQQFIREHVQFVHIA